MIGWTGLGVVKVWINEDYALNRKAASAVSEEMMVKDLVKVLQDAGIFRAKTPKSLATFQSLLANLDKVGKEKMFKKGDVSPLPLLKMTQLHATARMCGWSSQLRNADLL